MATVRRDIGTEVAKMAGLQPHLEAAAQDIANRAKASAPKDTGAYAASIKVESDRTPYGVTDRIVYSDDPAAAAIEWGYVTKSGSYVPGHYTMTRAAGN